MRFFITSIFLILFIRSTCQNQIYATIAGGDLYSFDISNCTRQFIGSTGLGFGDIAFTPDGRLWGVISGQLYEIDPMNAAVSFVGQIGFETIALVALNDTTLLVEAGLNLYRINTNTATPTFVGNIGYGASGDLTWYDDDLYIVTPLIRIELNDTYTQILDVEAVSLDVPVCEGAVTASFEDDFNAILGFNGEDLIKICQIDGSWELVCPDLNIGGTPGAASIRLPNQVPEPVSCCYSVPSITCGEDVVVNIESPETFATLNIPNPTVTQECGSYTLTNDFNGQASASGDYPVGTTVVSFIADDNVGNTATCSVTVTVIDNAQSCCPADYNCDGVVSVLDLIEIVNQFGCMGSSCDTDLDGDNIVGVEDMQDFIGLYGNVGYCD